jgi:hypothetical protein
MIPQTDDMADERDERGLEVDEESNVTRLRSRRGPGRQTRARDKSRTGPGRRTVGRDREAEKNRDDVAVTGTTRDRGADPLEPDSRSERMLQRNTEVTAAETDTELVAAERGAEREAGRSQRLADAGVSSARTDRHVAESLRRDPGLESDAPSRAAYLEDEAVRKDVVSRGDQDAANDANADAKAARAARSSRAPSLKNETTPEAATAGQPRAQHAAVAPSSTPVASKGRSGKGQVRSHSRKGQEK